MIDDRANERVLNILSFEVDAPLDDANIGRFVHVLKEFARTTKVYGPL